MKFFKKTSNIVLLVIGLAVISGGAYLLTRPAAAEENTTSTLQTAKVRKGDLVITASGAGTVFPVAQVDLGFRSGGSLSELNVAVGDAVKRGDILARLDGNLQAETDLQALFSGEGVARSELAVINAQDALDDATNDLIYLLGSSGYYWDQELKLAEEKLTALNADSSANAQQKADVQATVDRARTNRDFYLAENIQYLEDTYLYYVDDGDIALARYNVQNTQTLLMDAEAALEIVKGGPTALQGPLTVLGPEMARLEQTRVNVENTRLTAPFDGRITSLNAAVGQNVGTASIMTIATTDELVVRFYLDETDLDKAITGNQVTFLFDAHPDSPVNGEIISVEPSLQTVDGTPVVVAWAKLPIEKDAIILPGMTVEVEVIAGEARNVLIVPVQALRELSPGSYAVFIVQSDGSLKMTPVEVGLQDYANAEIISGVQIGDVVSTGTIETK